MHTYASLTADLEKSGISRSDTLLIHSSMKSIGDVEGRADTVLDVLMDYFKEDGLLLMPTLTWSNVNDKQPIFDVRNTPSVVGILPQLFRQRPGVWRSLHPTHSIAGYGRFARTFLEGHERFDSPGNAFSPWGRLPMVKAKIMFLGCDAFHNTMLHAVEEWNEATVSLTDYHQPLVSIDYDGVRHEVPSRRHLGAHSGYYGFLIPHFKAIGAYSEFHFGDAFCMILDAQKITKFVLGVLAEYPDAFVKEWNEAHPDFFESIMPK